MPSDHNPTVATSDRRVRSDPNAVRAPRVTEVRTFVMSERRTMVDLLGASFNVVGASSTPGPEVVEAARAGAAVVIDGTLNPTQPALVACVARCRQSGASVIVLFCPHDMVTTARWVELGASAVLTHDSPLAEIADTLERLSRNETVLGVSIREGLLSHLRASRSVETERNALFLSLTKREAEVLHELAIGAAPDEVARVSFVSLNTVRTQIRGILAKLGVSSVVAAVALAYRTGWVAPDLL